MSAQTPRPTPGVETDPVRSVGSESAATTGQRDYGPICQIALGGGYSGEPWDPPDCLCPDCREVAREMDQWEDER